MSLEDKAATSLPGSDPNDGIPPAAERAGIYGGRPFRAKRPPDCARCGGCGGDAISAYPTFSAGSGVAARPYSDDVICRQCGHIGPPTIAAS